MNKQPNVNRSIYPARHRWSALAVAVGALAASAGSAGSAWGQLRVVQYNFGGACRTGMNTIMLGIAAENRSGIAKPIDIFALEEQTNTTTDDFLTVLNGIYGAGAYAKGVSPTVNSGLPVNCVYRTSTVDLTNSAAISTGGPRDTGRYILRPKGYTSIDAQLILYVSHLKASDTTTDANTRAAEVAAIRANADALGARKNIIYAGDMNIYAKSTPQTAYTNFFVDGNGKAAEVSGAPANWSGTANRIYHSQSPATTSAYGGQVLGGMNDRFDMQLPSVEMTDGRGISFIPGTYRVFGNNGTHTLNGAITTGTGASAALLTTLSQVTDHLPVVVDYQIPASMAVSVGAVNAKVAKGSFQNLAVNVWNDANAVASNGADVLTYKVNVTGSTTWGTADNDPALGGTNTYSVRLNTASAGSKSATVAASTSSQGAKNATFSQGVNYAVYDDAKPSFSSSSQNLVKTVQFGYLKVGQVPVAQSIGVSNLVVTAGFTAGLDLDTIATSGSGFTSTIATFTNATAGSTRLFSVGFSGSTQRGVYRQDWTLGLSDDNSINGATANLSMRLTALANVASYIESTTATPGTPRVGGLVGIAADPTSTTLTSSVLSFDGLVAGDVSVSGVRAPGAENPMWVLVGLSGDDQAISAALSDWQLTGARVTDAPADLSGLITSKHTVLVGLEELVAGADGLSLQWNLTGTGASLTGIAVVPEPGFMSFALAALATLSRRRR